MTGMDIDEASEFINTYMDRYPKLKAWIQTEGDNAIKLGYSTSIYGRKRFYKLPDPENRDYDKIIGQIRRWGGNFPIQATNADMLKLAMHLIYLKMRGGIMSNKPILSGRFKLVVHDEIVMESTVEDAPKVAEIIKSSMKEAYDMLIKGINLGDIKVNIGQIWLH